MNRLYHMIYRSLCHIMYIRCSHFSRNASAPTVEPWQVFVGCRKSYAFIEIYRMVKVSNVYLHHEIHARRACVNKLPTLKDEYQ